MQQQTNLLELKWDDENPISENGSHVDEWIKLEKGDTLIGVYVDKYEDQKYNRMKYFFSNATIIKAKDSTKISYNKIGMNTSGNLDFTLKDDELLGTPLKIIRMDDIPIEGKPKPAHHFKIIKPKQ